MLRWRLLLGTLLVALVALLGWLDSRTVIPGVWLFPLALLATLAATGEILWMLGDRPSRPVAWVALVGNALIVSSNWLPFIAGYRILWPGAQAICASATLALAVLLAFGSEIQRYRAPGMATARLAATSLTFTYIGLMMSFVVQLRLLASGALGVMVLVSLIITVKLGDIGAYTVGRLIGRHRMAPLLSPGKTLEGAAGGLVFACFGACLGLCVLWPLASTGLVEQFSAVHWLSYGVLVGLAGMFGDLAESLLKRDLGCKDSSPWLPGFGGVLDIIDSILLAAPPAFVWWLAMSQLS
ncbi:MAG TPA: phosphatidate cytidylyltransferase [Pirellulales bacterium]|nr:phosphatidate cytidylyltransferase [Pirellulales bacterium]